jgi:hypothetical protein
MISSPFKYALTGQELQKLGELMLTWSHTEDLIANSLRVLLRLDGDEGVVIVYPLTLEMKLRRVAELTAKKPVSADTGAAVKELRTIIPAIQYLRNSVAHCILTVDEAGDPAFLLRSKERTISKSDLFASEELTNYACWVAFALRWNVEGQPMTLPGRPDIPDFLRPQIPNRKKSDSPPAIPPRPSRA